MNIDTKKQAVKNIISLTLTGFLIAGGFILLLFLIKNLEVNPSPWALFFTICKWLTEFLFMITYTFMAREVYENVMKWVDKKNVESVKPNEHEQVNAIKEL